MTGGARAFRVELGRLLRRSRLAAGLSCSEVAEACGVNRRSVHKWEAGIAAPKLDRHELLGAALGVPISRLITQALRNVPPCAAPHP